MGSGGQNRFIGSGDHAERARGWRLGGVLGFRLGDGATA